MSSQRHHKQTNHISQLESDLASDQNNYGRTVFIRFNSGVDSRNGNNDGIYWFVEGGGGVDRHKLGETNISPLNILKNLKLFSPSDNILKAFANCDITIHMTLPNEGLKNMEFPGLPEYWLQNRIRKYQNLTLNSGTYPMLVTHTCMLHYQHYTHV